MRRRLTQVLGAPGDIDAIQASVLRALASAHRLRIIHRLGIEPCEVNELSRALGLSQAATSQHLAAMRAVGLVEAVRDGRTVRYELCDPEILAACSLMRGALLRRLSRLGDLAASAGRPTDIPIPSSKVTLP
jgi:ArsR family transcriptional regulator, virulence genes transcriptional regulator